MSVTRMFREREIRGIRTRGLSRLLRELDINMHHLGIEDASLIDILDN